MQRLSKTVGSIERNKFLKEAFIFIIELKGPSFTQFVIFCLCYTELTLDIAIPKNLY